MAHARVRGQECAPRSREQAFAAEDAARGTNEDREEFEFEGRQFHGLAIPPQVAGGAPQQGTHARTRFSGLVYTAELY